MLILLKGRRRGTKPTQGRRIFGRKDFLPIPASVSVFVIAGREILQRETKRDPDTYKLSERDSDR